MTAEASPKRIDAATARSIDVMIHTVPSSAYDEKAALAMATLAEMLARRTAFDQGAREREELLARISGRTPTA